MISITNTHTAHPDARNGREKEEQMIELLATYSKTDGTPAQEMTIAEAEALIEKLGDRVAESYMNDAQDAEVYEVYGEGECADDYPDGDPYADTITIPHH